MNDMIIKAAQDPSCILAVPPTAAGRGGQRFGRTHRAISRKTR